MQGVDVKKGVLLAHLVLQGAEHCGIIWDGDHGAFYVIGFSKTHASQLGQGVAHSENRNAVLLSQVRFTGKVAAGLVGSRADSVSYTHLDVYKRQALLCAALIFPKMPESLLFTLALIPAAFIILSFIFYLKEIIKRKDAL